MEPLTGESPVTCRRRLMNSPETKLWSRTRGRSSLHEGSIPSDGTADVAIGFNRKAIHMNKAYDLGPVNPSATGDQRLYRLDPPIEGYPSYDDEAKEDHTYEYVVVSALEAAFDTGRPETYMFGANELGVIVDFMEIGASQRGTTSHELVVRESGYTIVPFEE
jgi:hypothetical protein